jgi:hypothetical protein
MSINPKKNSFHFMRTRHLLLSVILCMGLLDCSMGIAQSSGYVKQIITTNSGKFEYSLPYTDYATVQAYNPQTGSVNLFNTIYTQSTQCVVVSGKMGYVAAQDSIVKYDLNSMQRVAAVKDSGLGQLAVLNGKLIVSKQYPITNNFVEVLDTANLGIIAEISGISGDCGGIMMINDTVYVAVNGGWMGTNGKLAIINPSTWTLNTEVDFGSEAIGIFNLYSYKEKLFSINKTPYGVVDTGSITVYNPLDRSFMNVIINHTVSAGAGIKDSLLYLGLDNGIGSFNLKMLKVQDSIIVPDPGSSVFTYITSSVVDTLNGRIYVNIGDYVTPGYCLVTALNGDSITSFSTGISSDAIAVDYRFYPAGIPNTNSEESAVKVFPNPVLDNLTIVLDGHYDLKRLLVSDISGRVLLTQSIESMDNMSVTLSCQNLPSGMYYVIIETSNGRLVKPFIKQ